MNEDYIESELRAKGVLNLKHKFPIKIVKDMRAGGTTSMVKESLTEGNKTVLIVPRMSIADEKSEFFNGLGYKVAIFGPNEDICDKIDDINMPLKFKKNCMKCKEWYNGTCLYANIIWGLEDKEIDLLILTFHKLYSIINNKELRKKFVDFVDIIVVDECGAIIDLERSRIQLDDLRVTSDYKKVKMILAQILVADEGKWFSVKGDYGEECVEFYRDEYLSEKRYDVGQTILFLKEREYFIDGDSLVSKNNIQGVIDLLIELKHKSIYIDSTVRWPKLERKLFKMTTNIWDMAKIHKYHHYIIVDENSISGNNLKIRLNLMQKEFEDMIIVCLSKKQAYGYGQKYETTYYRGPLNKGVAIKNRFMFCIGLPWVKNMHNLEEEKQEEMRGIFTQMTGRVIDPKFKDPSIVYVVNTTVDELADKFYTGFGTIIPIRGNSNFKRIKVIKELLLSEFEAEPDEYEWIAKAISSKRKPSDSLSGINKHIYRKYHEFILTEWKRRVNK